MFTGIIESLGQVSKVEKEGENLHFEISSSISNELKVDQSVAHNGACLTVTAVGDRSHRVTAVYETLQKTDLGCWKVGDKVNLERCMLNNGRFDGHIVQGHVDQLGRVISIEDQQGSWRFGFAYDSDAGNVTVEKGSVTVNGVSLTCFDVDLTIFHVAIIPYTYQHTTFHQLRVGDTVNLEFDIIGKYVKRLLGMAKP